MHIQELTLYTKKLAKTRNFYSEILHLPLVKKRTESFTVKAGESLLTFKTDHQTEIQYPFAFEIPNYLLNQAVWFQNQKGNLHMDADPIKISANQKEGISRE